MKRFFMFICLIAILLPIVSGQDCNDTLKWKTQDIYFVHFTNYMTGKYKMGSLSDTTINTNEIPNFITMGVLISTIDNSARSIFYEYAISDKQGNIVFSSLDTVAVKSYKAYDTIGIAQANNKHEINISQWDTGIYSIKLWVKSTSLDDEFCDSIKELSSYTAHFRISHGNTSVKKIATIPFNIYPNPASDFINVECGEIMHEITLYNTAGQQMRQITPCDSEVQISVSGLPRGLYLLEVQTDSGSTVRKLIVE